MSETVKQEFELTKDEVDEIFTSPESLTTLIDYHDQQSTYADAISESVHSDFVKAHDDRRHELETLRKRALVERTERQKGGLREFTRADLDAAVEQARKDAWDDAIRAAQQSVKKSAAAGLNISTAEILIRRLEQARELCR